MPDDYPNVPFTVVEGIDRRSRSYDTFQIQILNINLRQTPFEILNMQVDIEKFQKIEKTYLKDKYSMSSIRSESIYVYNYNVKLEFSNYLHEFNQNYRYEVICRAKSEVEREMSGYLFGCVKSRSTESVVFEGKFVWLMSYSITHSNMKFYFYVRRLKNDSCIMIADEKLQNVISTFRNTGCDAVLDAKDGRLTAHRSILSQNSDVFQAMFSAEVKESQDGIVNMLEFEARVVRKMLDYLYTRQLGELEDMTESLFKLAHRYQLHDLCRHCEEYYIFNVKVDNDNIVEVLKLSDVYELKNLNKCALNFVNRHEQELIKLASFREYLIQSVKLDNAVTTLLLADKYNAADVKIKIFAFIKNNYKQMMKDKHFLELFESQGRLMKEIYVYLSE